MNYKKMLINKINENYNILKKNKVIDTKKYESEDINNKSLTELRYLLADIDYLIVKHSVNTGEI